MTDHYDEDGSWWERASQRRQRRPFERTREHRVVGGHGEVPVVDEYGADGWDEPDAWVVPERRRRPATGVDPRLMRRGAIAAAAVVLVPVMVALTAGGSDGEELRADKVTTIETVTPQALSDVSDDTGVPVSAALSYVATTEPIEDDEDGEAAASASGEKGRPEAVADPAEESEEPAAAAEEPECAGTYTVVAGDYWSRFVESSGATLDEWLAANDAQPDTQIYEGDELCIPAGAQAPTAAETPEPAPEPEAEPEAASSDDDGEETTTTAAATTTTAAPAAAPAPAATSAGAPSTEALCGAMPTDNGSPAGVAGPAEVEAIIREIWPDDIEARALCIAKREANLRPDLNNWCCYGVFALYFDYVPADLKAQYGVDEPADLYDPRTNVAIAYQIYARGGWDPWVQTDPGSG